MLDKTGNWLEESDHVLYNNKECIITEVGDNHVCLNALDGSLYCGLRNSEQDVKLIKKSTDALIVYYRYCGCPNVSCVTLTALLDVVRYFEDNYQNVQDVEEVQLIVDKKDQTITERAKSIGYIKNGDFMRRK